MKKSLRHVMAKTLLLTILASMLLLNVLVMSVNAQEPVIELNPSIATIPEVGQYVILNVTIANATDMWAWQVLLSVNNDTVLNITSAWLPTMTNEDYVFYGRTTVRPAPSFSDLNGNGNMESVLLADTIMIGDSFTGSGLLCQLNITGVALGTSDVNFSKPLGTDTLILDSMLEDVTFTVTDGNITVVPEFPAFAIVPLLMISTLVAVLIARRKWANKQYTNNRL